LGESTLQFGGKLLLLVGIPEKAVLIFFL